MDYLFDSFRVDYLENQIGSVILLVVYNTTFDNRDCSKHFYIFFVVIDVNIYKNKLLIIRVVVHYHVSAERNFSTAVRSCSAPRSR